VIDLERSLNELADRLVTPDGDWLADDVVRRISLPEPRRVPRRGALALAGAFVVVVVVAVLVLPGPRRTLARWLGFDSVRIEPAPTVPQTTPSATSAPSGTPPPIVTTSTLVPPALDLGPSVSMAEATSQAGLPDPTPSLLGPPIAIHVVHPPESGQIMLVYSASDLVPQSPVTGVGALVSVMPAHIDDGMFRKMLLDTATVRSVDVGGSPGFWIEGAPHQLVFESGGQFESDTFRLATNTLLWQHGDDVYRVEADIALDTALRIAESIATS